MAPNVSTHRNLTEDWNDFSPSILGIIDSVNINSTTGILVGTILFIIFGSFLAKDVTAWGLQQNSAKLIDNLLQQILVMSVASYIVFIVQSCFIDVQDVGQSLEFVNIFLVFMGFSFAVQAIQLIQLGGSHTVTTRRFLNQTSTEIKAEFEKFINPTISSSFILKGRRFLAFHAPELLCIIWLVPNIRCIIESKILESYFHLIHDIPLAFNFAKYLSHSFKLYAHRISKVSARCWGVLAILIVLNLIRDKFIVNHSESICSKTNLLWKNAGTSDISCESYIILSFAAVMGWISLACLCVLLGHFNYCYSCLLEEAIAEPLGRIHRRYSHKRKPTREISSRLKKGNNVDTIVNVESQVEIGGNHDEEAGKFEQDTETEMATDDARGGSGWLTWCTKRSRQQVYEEQLNKLAEQEDREALRDLNTVGRVAKAVTTGIKGIIASTPSTLDEELYQSRVKQHTTSNPTAMDFKQQLPARSISAIDSMSSSSRLGSLSFSQSNSYSHSHKLQDSSKSGIMLSGKSDLDLGNQNASANFRYDTAAMPPVGSIQRSNTFSADSLYLRDSGDSFGCKPSKAQLLQLSVGSFRLGSVKVSEFDDTELSPVSPRLLAATPSEHSLGTSVGRGKLSRSITGKGKLGLTASFYEAQRLKDSKSFDSKSLHSGKSSGRSPLPPAPGTRKSTIHKDAIDVHEILSDKKLAKLYNDCIDCRNKKQHYRSILKLSSSVDSFMHWLLWLPRKLGSWLGVCKRSTSKYSSFKSESGSESSRSIKRAAHLNLETMKKFYFFGNDEGDSLVEDSDNKRVPASLKGTSGLYYAVVELAFFCQALYVAFWASQLIPMAAHSAATALDWVFILTIPMLVNFRLLQCILCKAVLFEAIRKLNMEVMLDVFTETLAAEAACLDLRNSIRFALATKQIDTMRWKAHIQVMCDKYSIRKFDKVTHKYDKYLNRYGFRQLLESLDIFLDVPTFDILWAAIDRNLSDTVTWDEVYLVAYPEFRRHFNSYMSVMQRIHDAIETALLRLAQTREAPVSKQHFLSECYEYFDPGRRKDCISRENVQIVLRNLGVKVTALEENQLFAFVGISSSDTEVTWKQFLAMLDPTNPLIDKIQSRPALKTALISEAPNSPIRANGTLVGRVRTLDEVSSIRNHLSHADSELFADLEEYKA